MERWELNLYFYHSVGRIKNKMRILLLSTHIYMLTATLAPTCVARNTSPYFRTVHVCSTDSLVLTFHPPLPKLPFPSNPLSLYRALFNVVPVFQPVMVLETSSTGT